MKIPKSNFLLFLIILVVVFQPISFGASLIDSLDLSLEKEIGYYNFHTLVRKRPEAKLDRSEQKRIDAIFSRLLKNSERSDEVEYRLTIVRDPSINACALPGGYIFLNTGLIDFAQTDGEIAGVLAHEIAHVEYRHGMKALYRATGMGFAWGAVMNRNKSKHKKLIERLGTISLSLLQLGYSREAEYEADRRGVELLIGAGYNKQELVNFWKRVQSDSNGGELTGIFQLLSTHPPLTERIQQIEALE
ncbi:MAG TPA: M48 family metallopeptidase [Bacillota bacterium]|jgi:predicted Zn-dependent protease|nr:M48 family metallopeptidase [Bacillota bacterium]HOL08512.1 M48 family metallopeptidase [Bacillota bacterium]HPO97007.1 M48 family metallopeptidase [Bacillota bacterium]